MNKVSVIIPVYNAEKTLRKCVESIVYGEEQNIEIILVEDDSNDNSWHECLELQKEFSQVVCKKNEHNKGVSYTRNQGLREARGKYILFVDSDDWVSGKYVKHMLDAAIENYERFVMCGYIFIDELHSNKTVNLFTNGKNTKSVLPEEDFFALVSKVHLQQLWNKIFRRDIIEQNHIRFDESQKMGEDFQFVLDYLQAAQIEQCVVLNEALYYYIRANDTSLMSKFGIEKQEKTFERYAQLLNICGVDNLEVQKKYQNAIQNIKNNLIYQIVHSNVSKQDKIRVINQVMDEGNASYYYKQQCRIIAKERVVKFLNKCKELPKRMEGRLQRKRRNHKVLKAKKLLMNENFSIISQNCIGGVFYSDMGMKFLSPTINLYFKEPDFVRFVQKLEYYMGLELEMSWEEEYPVGRLDDITVYFMHYNTCREAKESWEKRKQRINWNKIVILATDMVGFDDSTWKEWKKIQYPKILFSATDRNSSEVVCFSKYKELGHVPDLIPDREFYKDGMLIKVVNSL